MRFPQLATLARQMKREADQLTIRAALMEGSRANIPAADIHAYGRAQRLAIMNYWVYFNQNPAIDAADLIIMDDAHLAEYCLHSLYSLEIDYQTHKSLFRSVVTVLREHFPEYPVLSDALADDAPPSTKAELLSFLDQCAVVDRLREIIDSSSDVGEPHHLTDFGFRWLRIRDRLREANVYLSSTSIWIRPYIYPLLSNLMYEQATQRLYMSATIGDPGDLSRRLGVRRVEKIPIPAAFSDMTMGRRLVIMNRIAEEDIPSRFQHAILAALRIHPKSVWLCSSKDDASKFERLVSEWLNQNGLVGHPAWMLTPEGDEIDAFKQAPKGHLFVAGRFDGMDFLADECRLVIITTLPRAVNLQEEFLTAYLRDAGFMRRRLNQRIGKGYSGCIVCLKCFTGKSALVRERMDYRGSLSDGRTVCVLPIVFEAPGEVSPEQWCDPQYWLDRVDGKQCWIEERAPAVPTGLADGTSLLFYYQGTDMDVESMTIGNITP